MKITNLLFVLCFSVLELSAQNLIKVDSLKLLVSNNKTSDSTLIVGYNELGIQYANSDSRLAKSYINKALNIAKSSKNQRSIAGAQNCLGIVYYYQKEYDSALACFNKALIIDKKENYLWGQASALHQIGVIHKYQYNYLQAITNFQESGLIFKSMNDSISYAKSIENMARCYYLNGYDQKAMSLYLKTNEIYESKRNINGISRISTHISQIWIGQKEYKKALSYLNKALTDLRKTHNVIDLSSILIKIGECYSGLKNYAEALIYYNKALDNRIKTNNKKNIASIQSRIGEIYYYLKDYNKAIEYGMKSIKNSSLVKGDYRDKCFSNQLIAKNYLSMSKLTLAKKYINKAIEVAMRIGNLEDKKTSYDILIEIFEEEGNINKAFKYAKIVNVLKDSISEIKKDEKVRELQAIYETEKKEKRINQQQHEIQVLKQEQKISDLKRKIVLIIIVFITIILGFGFYINRQRAVQSRLLAKHTVLEKEKLDNELAYKKRELVTHSLHITKKNRILEKIKENLISIEETSVKSCQNQLIQSIQKELRDGEENWGNFKNYFEKIHPNFYTMVKQKYPKVTQGELRLIALIKMNLSYKEIGEVLNITNEGVKKARYRLRKKLEITPDQSLYELINRI